MTAYPVPANAGCWWVVTGRRGRLHAVAGGAVTRAEMDDRTEDGGPLVRTAVCGRTADWTMPGLGSLLGLARCRDCCRRLGVPAGGGTPANEGVRP